MMMRDYPAFMKTIVLCLGMLCWLVGVSLGAEPDFSKAFPKEKLFNEANLGNTLSYTYLTDSEYKDLEKQLIKFLGDDWKKDDPVDGIKEDEELAAMFKKQGMEFKGMISLSRKGDPGTIAILQMIKMKTKIAGKDTLLTLTVVSSKEAVEEVPEKEEPAKKEKQPTGGILEKPKK